MAEASGFIRFASGFRVWAPVGCRYHLRMYFNQFGSRRGIRTLTIFVPNNINDLIMEMGWMPLIPWRQRNVPDLCC